MHVRLLIYKIIWLISAKLCLHKKEYELQILPICDICN